MGSLEFLILIGNGMLSFFMVPSFIIKRNSSLLVYMYPQNAQPTVSPAFCRHCDRRGHATRDCTFQKNRRTESKVFEKKATQEIGHTSTENAVKFEQPRDPRPPRQLDYRSGNNNSPQYHSRDRDERPGQAAATMSTSLDALKKSHSLHENDGWGGAPYSHREDINNTRPESLYQSSNANGNSQSSEIASSSHNVQGQERVAQKTSTHIHFPTDPRVRKSSSQAPPATLDSSSDRGASIRAEAVIKGESFSVQKSLPRPWTEPSLQQNAQSDAEVIIIDEPTISSSSHIRSFTSPTNRINVSLSGPPQKPTSVLPPSQTQPRSTDKPVATPTVRKTEQISPSTPVRQTGNPQESPDSERVSLASLAKTVAAPPSTEGSASKRKRSSTGPKTTLLSKRKPFNGLLPSAQITSITHVDELDDENEDDETDLQTQTSPSPSATQTVSRGQARESLVPRQSSNQTASIKSRPSIGSDPADTPPMVDYTAILAIVTDLEKTRFDIRDQRGYYQRMVSKVAHCQLSSKKLTVI